MRKSLIILLSLIILAAACGPINWPILTPQPTLSTPSADPTGTPKIDSAETLEPPITPAVISLKIWVPPHMDPDADTPSGKLLKARLDQFSRQHDDLIIDVRVKTVAGPGGLLDSLAATSAAAPLALPDLIALPREGLEAAALKGLLQVIESPEAPLDDSSWYEYARQLVRVQNSVFGYPICGDALVTVFRPSIVSEPPADWAAVLEQKTPFVFPAADPQAVFSLAMYQASGVKLRDEEGKPYLEQDQLSKVLTFYADAEERGVMPFWLTQYQDDQEVWEAFMEKRADLIVAWLSDYLVSLPEDTAFSILPVDSQQPFTLADGWVWSVSSLQEEKRQISIELAQFLSENKFLNVYSESLGCLSPFINAVDSESDPTEQVSSLEQISLSARMIPSTDILTSLGLPVQQAVMQVLKNQVEPIPAAQSAVDALTSP